MNIFSRTVNWAKHQTATNGDDFKERAPKTEPRMGKTVGVSAAVGAGVGALVGGGAAAHSVSNDTVFIDYVTEELPLAASGPEAWEVFGDGIGSLETLVRSHSEGSTSGGQTLQYLSYLKFQNPDLPAEQLQGLYNSLESQFGNDQQVREALNMISAHVDKYGTTAAEAHKEFTNYFGYEDDFGRATQMFLEDQKMSPEELKTISFQMVEKHTSPIGHLGMAKGVALGIATGAAIGAVTGVVTGVGIHVVQKLIQS